YELNPVGGSNGPMLSYNGSPIHAGQFIWTPIGAEATASGYEIALETTLQGSLYYTVWNTDNNGNYVGNAIGAVAGNSATLESYESSLHQDLNGDGTIGAPASSHSLPANVSAIAPATDAPGTDHSDTPLIGVSSIPLHHDIA